MSTGQPLSGYDRVLERRRAVALAHHFREAEALSIPQVAARLGRSPATVKAYLKARAVKARYVGVCRGCGAYTQPHNGKGDAYAYCKACHPGAIQRRWTRERVLEAMGEWLDRCGRLPSSYDWSRTHARRRGGEALRRLEAGEWPPASVVTSVFGSWVAAREAARLNAPAPTSLGPQRPGRVEGSVDLEPEAALGRQRVGARRAEDTVNLGAQGIDGIGASV
jgi:hypothetical protein